MEMNEYFLLIILITLGFMLFHVCYYLPLLSAKQISVLVSSKSSRGMNNDTIGVNFEFEGKKYSLFDIKADHGKIVNGENTLVWFTPKRSKHCCITQYTFGGILKLTLIRAYYLLGIFMLPILSGYVK